MSKTYSELIKIPTFLERYEYLKVPGIVGAHTFGSVRFLNQDFYKSGPWLEVRDFVIVRDDGCDLGIKEREVVGRILIHHIDPVTKDMVHRNDTKLLDPDNLISTSLNTHQAIHYGDVQLLKRSPTVIDRRQNDTCLWR